MHPPHCTTTTASEADYFSDTDMYTVIFSGTHFPLPADIFYPLARRYSTSDLFPTWALLDVGSVPDANLVRSMRASKNSSPAAMRSDLCCATSCAHRCVARSALCCTVPRVSNNISRLPILGCSFVPAPARFADVRRCRHLRSIGVLNTNI